MVGDLKYIDFDGNGYIDAQDGVVGDEPWSQRVFTMERSVEVSRIGRLNLASTALAIPNGW